MVSFFSWSLMTVWHLAVLLCGRDSLSYSTQVSEDILTCCIHEHTKRKLISLYNVHLNFRSSLPKSLDSIWSMCNLMACCTAYKCSGNAQEDFSDFSERWSHVLWMCSLIAVLKLLSVLQAKLFCPVHLMQAFLWWVEKGREDERYIRVQLQSVHWSVESAVLATTGQLISALFQEKAG